MQILVIGAGVVGLAVARQAALAGHDVIVAEATSGIGNGVSSRNSEVIHGGMYYPTGSLRALHCTRGRRMLYEFCASHGVPHRKCGKLIVATNAAEASKIAAIQQQGLSQPLADDTAYYIGVFYRRHGYPSVDVKYRIQGEILELDISEGLYYKLGEIYFEGNKTFQPSALNEYMVGTTRARFSQFQHELPFVEADLITGTSLLQSFYVSQGFPQVQIVKLSTIPDAKRGAVDAVVTIKEGPRYYFGPITFSRNPGIPKENFAPKISALTNPPKPYSAAELQNLQRDLTFLFKKEGYYEASVSVTPDFKKAQGGAVPITVDAIPGSIYHFGALVEHQDPRARLRPKFLTARFSGLRGQVYDPDKLTDLYTKLYLTGLFDALDVQEVAEPDQRWPAERRGPAWLR